MATPTPGDTSAVRLGIDIGTCHTVAVLRWPDGRARTLLFDGSPLLPSAPNDAAPMLDRDAIHAAGLDPHRTASLAAVLQRVRDEAVRVAGRAELTVALTHPGRLSGPLAQDLASVCRRGGLPEPMLVPKPVAAASYFVTVLGHTLPTGSRLLVYDFGGGTFEASVVTAAANGFVILATRSLEDVGGVDLDAAILDHLARTYAESHPQAWQRLDDPRTSADRRHRRHLLEDVRAAKEMLSRADHAGIPVPLLELEARVSRLEFEGLARPLLDRTIASARDAIAGSALAAGRIVAALLVGGSSRVPLVARLLREQLGLTPVTTDEPETSVAQGAAIPGAAQPNQPPLPVQSNLASQPTQPVQSDLASQPTQPVQSNLASQPTELVRPHVPTQPTAPPDLANLPTVPVQPRGAYQDSSGGRAYRGALVKPSRHRWIPIVLASVVVAGLAVGAVLIMPGLLNQGATPQDPAGRSTPYVRTNPPQWLPAGFGLVIDDAATASVDTARGAGNGGTCVYEAPGVLRVRRDAFDITACFKTEAVRQTEIADGAVEAEFTVRSGCGVMWLRVTNVGYAVMVCRDGSVDLHRLMSEPASAFTRLGSWRPAFDPANVVVGLLAQGNQLTVYVNGTAQEPVQDPAPFAHGRVGLGAFQPGDVTHTDVTITRFRAWAAPVA